MVGFEWSGGVVARPRALVWTVVAAFSGFKRGDVGQNGGLGWDSGLFGSSDAYLAILLTA